MITGFICHDDYLAKTSKLTDEEIGRLFRFLMQYHISGEAPEIEGREALAFDFIREDIDKAERAYKAKCETNRRNRLSTVENGGKRPITIVTNVEQKKPKADGENTKAKRFVPPTKEQVEEYCKERNNKVDAQRFVDFYESKGWKVGNQPMKDWKAAVRTWERDDKQKTQVQAQNYEQRDYSGATEEAIERMMSGWKK